MSIKSCLFAASLILAPMVASAQCVANFGGDLCPGNNLSDVANPATSRVNLGLGSIATQSASAFAVTGGTMSGVTITGSPISGSTGSFSTLSASGTVTFSSLLNGFLQVNGSGVASAVTTVPGSSVIGTTGTIAAAGTTLAGATNASSGYNTVGSGTGGVKSPAAQATGTCITAYNGTGSTINYYPDTTSDTINNLSAGTAHTIATLNSLVVCRTSSTTFFAYGGS